jgi:hypothetical protein
MQMTRRRIAIRKIEDSQRLMPSVASLFGHRNLKHDLFKDFIIVNGRVSGPCLPALPHGRRFVLPSDL